MAYQDETLVEKAMFDHLEALTTDPVTAIAWPNVDFTGARPYLQVTHFRNTTRRETIDTSKTLRGILQVDVVFDLGQGVQRPLHIAGQVAAHFDDQDQLHTDKYRIRFDQPPTIAGALTEPDQVRIPISIPYIAND